MKGRLKSKTGFSDGLLSSREKNKRQGGKQAKRPSEKSICPSPLPASDIKQNHTAYMPL
jgi:hypothetical protein